MYKRTLCIYTGESWVGTVIVCVPKNISDEEWEDIRIEAHGNFCIDNFYLYNQTNACWEEEKQ
jgi:hypothetical protein